MRSIKDCQHLRAIEMLRMFVRPRQMRAEDERVRIEHRKRQMRCVWDAVYDRDKYPERLSSNKS
jgi:hypothetical protein